MRRRDLLVGCFAGIALAGAACRGRQPAAAQKLRLSAGKLLSMSSLYLAQESGYFRDAGVDLELMQIPNPLDAMTLLAGGKVDIVFTGIVSSFLNAVLKGLTLKIVAGREIASPSCGTMGAIYGLRRNFPRGLEDLTQLKGKRIAAGPTVGLSHFALDSQLARAGLAGSDVITVNLPSAQAVAALIGGSVDAIVLNAELDRNLTAMSAEIVRTQGLSRVYPDMQGSFIYFGKTLLSGSTAVGAAFLFAYLRGVREFVQGRTPRYMEEFARANGLDVNDTVTACRGTVTTDGAVDLKSLQLFVAWAVRRKHIPQSLDALELVDLRFLRKAHAG
jgi:NitT/TauT family transport system substrate-binding protein